MLRDTSWFVCIWETKNDKQLKWFLLILQPYFIVMAKYTTQNNLGPEVISYQIVFYIWLKKMEVFYWNVEIEKVQNRQATNFWT